MVVFIENNLFIVITFELGWSKTAARSGEENYWRFILFEYKVKKKTNCN